MPNRYGSSAKDTNSYLNDTPKFNTNTLNANNSQVVLKP